MMLPPLTALRMQGSFCLPKNHAAGTDSWETGLNNNVLVLGCSGGGKTRNHLKPNLMQCQGSYVVLDAKGSLYYEMGPICAPADTRSTCSAAVR